MIIIAYFVGYIFIGAVIAGLIKRFDKSIDEDNLFPIVMFWGLFLALILTIGPFYATYKLISGDWKISDLKKISDKEGDKK